MKKLNGIVYSIKGNLITIKGEDHEWYYGQISKKIPRSEESVITIGDKIRFEVHSENQCMITHIDKRKNKISRLDPYHKNKSLVIAANIDQVFIISTIHSPGFKPNFVDRFLILASKENIPATIIINKSDLKKKVPESLNYYTQSLPVIFCSAKTGENISQIVSLLNGKTTLFTGQSGVGKSSLINAILPEAQIKTLPLRKKVAKGRHTTTSSQIYEMGLNTKIIDSPGIKKFDFDFDSPEEIEWYFPEFPEFSAQCKFSNCRHLEEPGCQVKNAVLNEQISSFRYNSYKKIVTDKLSSSKF